MPDIPSFFNRIDFISILLPGYVPIVAYLVIFRPATLFSEKALSFDLFSSVVFIVAGPALGLALLQLHRGALAIISILRARTPKKKAADEKFLVDYAKIRVKMKTEERLELDEAEALCDFSISTGLGLLALCVLIFLKLGWFRVDFILLLAGGIILILGAYLQWSEAYSPMFEILKKKYAKSRS